MKSSIKISIIGIIILIISTWIIVGMKNQQSMTKCEETQSFGTCFQMMNP